MFRAETRDKGTLISELSSANENGIDIGRAALSTEFGQRYSTEP